MNEKRDGYWGSCIGCGIIFCAGVFGPLLVPPLFLAFGVEPQDNPWAAALMLAPIILFIVAMTVGAAVGGYSSHTGAGGTDISGQADQY